MNDTQKQAPLSDHLKAVDDAMGELVKAAGIPARDYEPRVVEPLNMEKLGGDTDYAPRRHGRPVLPSTASSQSLEATLADRGAKYGPFAGHAEVTQDLKRVIAKHLQKRNKVLADDQQECLDMIFHKIGRAVNGDPDYDDNWVDMAGYPQLVANRLRGKNT